MAGQILTISGADRLRKLGCPNAFGHLILYRVLIFVAKNYDKCLKTLNFVIPVVNRPYEAFTVVDMSMVHNL